MTPQEKASLDRQRERSLREADEREADVLAVMARARPAEPPWPNLPREAPAYDPLSYFERKPAVEPPPHIPGSEKWWPSAPEPVRQIAPPRPGALHLDEGRVLLKLPDDLFDASVYNGALATFPSGPMNQRWFEREYIQLIVADAATVTACRKHLVDVRYGRVPTLPFEPPANAAAAIRSLDSSVFAAPDGAGDE